MGTPSLIGNATTSRGAGRGPRARAGRRRAASRRAGRAAREGRGCFRPRSGPTCSARARAPSSITAARPWPASWTATGGQSSSSCGAGTTPRAARDLTQGFFAAFLERDFLRYVDRARGKFRVFLRTALDHYLADEWDRARAEKRGGARPHLPLDFAQVEGEAGGQAADDDPERLFRRKWAVAVMRRALEAVQGEYRASDRAHEFEVLGGRLVDGAAPAATYAALAARLGWSEHDVNNRLHRMRKLYRDAIWRELRALTEDDAQAEEELRELFSAVAR